MGVGLGFFWPISSGPQEGAICFFFEKKLRENPHL